MDSLRKYRDCLGCFPTGVAIATTISADNALHGLTINSFSSVSLEPPLILFSLDRQASSFDAFHHSSHFAINILTETQAALSQQFSLSHMGKWADVSYKAGHYSGCPLIEDVMAVLECRKKHLYDGGDHLIFIGEVLHFEIVSPHANPLLYYRGNYRELGNSLHTSPKGTF